MARAAAAAHRPGAGALLSRVDAVILAGGRGQRMMPLTADCPKPLLPVGPWALVEHQISSLARLGVARVALATGYRHEDFEPVVRRWQAKGVDLVPVVEPFPLGTGGGLREGLWALDSTRPVVVLNGDLLTGHDIAAQVSGLLASSPGTLASVHVRDVDDARAYGTVHCDDEGRVTAFVEKSPAHRAGTVNAGTYVVRPELLDVIPREGTASLEREVFPRLAEHGALVAHPQEAYFLDVGTPAALVVANRDLLLDPWPGAAPAARGPALVLPGARVAPDAVLGGGTVVHPGAVVGEGAVLDSAVVLEGADLGAGCSVTRSVVGRRARVAPGATVIDDALGTGESRSA